MPLNRLDSTVTHVSDSEPERASTPEDEIPQPCGPLTPLTNFNMMQTTVRKRAKPRVSVNDRLVNLEEAVQGLRNEINGVRDRVETSPNKSAASPPPSTPLHKRKRTASDAELGSPRMRRSSLLVSTPEREENGRELTAAIHRDVIAAVQLHVRSRAEASERYNSTQLPNRRRYLKRRVNY
ncbi:hypothetical protein R3P38DRAFT_2795068 [Favolaschia claudopus]|uniref:Uncharacterized protein n=2 Tax=Favolaschia claudopus TaxID=2862362 RepID=A0AAW0A883_9AGAR